MGYQHWRLTRKPPAQTYRERIVGPVRGKLPESVVRSIEEQLSGACTTEIAAFDEFTALLTDSSLVGNTPIVFDTAPTGHTHPSVAIAGAWASFWSRARRCFLSGAIGWTGKAAQPIC